MVKYVSCVYREKKTFDTFTTFSLSLKIKKKQILLFFKRVKLYDLFYRLILINVIHLSSSSDVDEQHH